MSSRSMEKEMATQKWYCCLIYAVTMMTVKLWLRTTVIIHLGNIQQGAQKVGKATVFFRFPSKLNLFSAGLNQDQQWVILGKQVWCLSTCVAKQWVSVLSIVPPWDSRWKYFCKEYCELISSTSTRKGCNMCESRLFLLCQGHNIWWRSEQLYHYEM